MGFESDFKRKCAVKNGAFGGPEDRHVQSLFQQHFAAGDTYGGQNDIRMLHQEAEGAFTPSHERSSQER